jgi:hypothetical protein
MRDGVTRQEKLEPGAFCVMAVDVGVPDVIIRFRLKLRSYHVQLVFQYGELYGDIVVPPDALLIADHPIGAAADNVPQVPGHPDHLHGDATGRFAHLQGTVDIKTDQSGQIWFSCF